jgi:hypothetical protein
MSDVSRIISPRSWTAIGVVVLVCGVAISLARASGGVDFPVLYVMGRGLLTGTNVYLPSYTATFPEQFGIPPAGMFYPAATGFAMLPLALLPLTVAKWAFAFLTEIAVVWGIRALVRTAAPKAPAQVWMISAGVVLASAAMRWGMMLLQLSPLVLGLLCWFVSLLNTPRRKLALAVAMLAMVLKMTLGLPFLALLTLRRRWWDIALIATTCLALNALGFWLMGPGSFAQYQSNIAGLEDLGYINSPDLWRPVALPRLDWVALFYVVTGSLTLARVTALALTGACGLWLLWIVLRSPRQTEMRTIAPLLGALVCLGSLGVYHHQYDAVVFFAPALLGLLVFDGHFRLGHFLIAPLVLMILTLPIGKAQTVLGSAMGLAGVALVKLAFPVLFTLALVGCLLLIESPHTSIESPHEPAT